MLKFGTGGVPITSKKSDTITGLHRIKELGLDFMEMEFVQGVRMGDDTAKKVSMAREELGLDLTIHGPYYINLATDDEAKLESSKNHIFQSIRVGTLTGAVSATFHPAFVQKLSHEEVYERVKNALVDLSKQRKENGLTTSISPELTGKESQFGRLEDLVQLCKEIPELRICYDFAHNYARFTGANNTQAEISASLSLIKKELGEKFLKNMHIHMSNIEYTPKGERNHLTYLKTAKEYTKEGVNKIIGEKGEEKLTEIMEEFYKSGKKIWVDTFDWRMILSELKKFRVEGHLVCESPLLEWDALLMKKYYESL